MHTTARVAAALTLAGSALAVAVTAPGSAAEGRAGDGHASVGGQSADLAALKKSLRPLQDSPAAAEAAGYQRATACVDSATGGMGYHYFNMELVMGPMDPQRPPVLVYVPGDDGRLTLGAVEWFQVDGDQDLTTDDDRPSLLGRAFDGPMMGHEEGMPIHYDLHAWIFRPNPAGVFSPYNPKVSC